MKIAIGTAQFGLNYGATNKKGVVSESEIFKILNYALSNNIFTIDTASAYGVSEKKLGNCNVELSSFQVITKIPPNVKIQDLETHFYKSLKNLNLDKIYGILVHKASDIFSDKNDVIWKQITKLKEQNLVDKIGISVYNISEIKQILAKYKFDLIQLPINIFDQRLLKSNILQRLKKANIEIHARSIFLQGVLLANPDNLSEYFIPFKKHFKKWHQFLSAHYLNPLEGTLAFANSLKFLDYAVIGVTSLNDLKEIKAAFDKIKSYPKLDYSDFASEDEALINPNLWTL